MTLLPHLSFNSRTDLMLERVVQLSQERIWAAWTTPSLLTQWFAPDPWTAHHAEVDLRPGGTFRVLMRSSEGDQVPCEGCFLELLPFDRLEWTDALTVGYRPSSQPFITAVISLSPHEEGTLYTLITKHRDEETKRLHQNKGFDTGCNRCLDQLIEVMSLQ
jgi:uncharacterized protein YndB with AHSA1/START domain